MIEPTEEWPPQGSRIGRRILVFDRLPSTNTYAAGLGGDPANDGTVVLARAQTAGRGQYGRSWQCEPGMGVLLSVLLFPSSVLLRPALLTAWAAVSVCATIHTLTGLQAGIKWPNDVLISGRKVCGILIEQGRGTVVGIGLNLNQTAEAFATAGLTQAGSLALLTGACLDHDEAARQLIRHLDEEYDRLCRGDRTTLERCWQERLGLLGKEVIAVCHDGASHRGRLRDVSWREVQIEAAEGQSQRLLPEAVRLLQASGENPPRPA